jgi:hypothetical protein
MTHKSIIKHRSEQRENKDDSIAHGDAGADLMADELTA